MKATHAIVLVVLAAACSEPPRPSNQEQKSEGDPPPALTAADSVAAVEQGGAIAGAVAQGLAQRLQAQLKEVGAYGAVDFCSKTALALTDSLLAGQPEGVSVKRTSTKIRNPRNAPDAHEQAALAWFDTARTGAGEIPKHYVQAVSDEEVRFYRPLMVAPFCTQCHGTAEQMEPRVQQILQQRYPQDRATGYQAGDLRGVIRVSLPSRERI